MRAALVDDLTELHLPAIRGCFKESARRSEQETLSYEQYLLELTEREREMRDKNHDARLSKAVRPATREDAGELRSQAAAGEGDAAVQRAARLQFPRPQGNLLLFGSPGAGKKHLLCALAHEMINRGRRMK